MTQKSSNVSILAPKRRTRRMAFREEKILVKNSLSVQNDQTWDEMSLNFERLNHGGGGWSDYLSHLGGEPQWPIWLYYYFRNKRKGALVLRWEPCSSGYGRRHMFKRSWDRIPLRHSRWIIFSNLFVLKVVFMFIKTENRLCIAHF